MLFFWMFMSGAFISLFIFAILWDSHVHNEDKEKKIKKGILVYLQIPFQDFFTYVFFSHIIFPNILPPSPFPFNVVYRLRELLFKVWVG